MGKQRVWPSVRGEMRCVLGLLHLNEVDLGARFCGDIFCGDSSSKGFAVHVSPATPEELRETWRYREQMAVAM